MKALVLSCFFAALAASAAAQDVTNVFGPEVTPGERAAEARVAFVPAGDGRGGRVAARLHYQEAVTDNVRLRTFVLGSGGDGRDFQFDFVQFEAQWQFLEDEAHGFDSALRADFRIADDGAPEQVALNWANDVPLNSRWSVRGVVLSALQFGANAGDGLFLQTREAVKYKINKDYSAELQVFSIYGSTADFPGFDGQNHSVGPALFGPIAPGWRYQTGVLFGVSDAAPDVDFRFFVVRAF